MRRHRKPLCNGTDRDLEQVVELGRGHFPEGHRVMVEVVESASGFVVTSDRYRKPFQCKANAILAARILATTDAVLSECDVDVVVFMRNGDVVRITVNAVVQDGPEQVS